MKELPSNLVEEVNSLSTFTPNYNLEKSDQDDFYNIDIHNKNYDIIDEQMKELSDKAEQALQSGADVKEQVKNAINSKTTVPDVTINDPWSLYIQRIEEIKEGRGNAQPSDVLSGKTFTNDTGKMLTGSMPNHRNKIVNLYKQSTTLPAGYYDGIDVKWDNDIKPKNIRKNITIYGVEGELEGQYVEKYVFMPQTDITFTDQILNESNWETWLELGYFQHPSYSADITMKDTSIFQSISIFADATNCTIIDVPSNTVVERAFDFTTANLLGKYQQNNESYARIYIDGHSYFWFEDESMFAYDFGLKENMISSIDNKKTWNIRISTKFVYDPNTGRVSIQGKIRDYRLFGTSKVTNGVLSIRNSVTSTENSICVVSKYLV